MSKEKNMEGGAAGQKCGDEENVLESQGKWANLNVFALSTLPPFPLSWFGTWVD